MKLLIVEDDTTLAANLNEILVAECFAVDLAQTISRAQVQLEVNEYDCVLLDLGLPDGSGFTFLEALRVAEDETPVVIMTARGEVSDRIRGLNIGADDYVPKPFDTLELIARIRAVIRRDSQHPLPSITIKSLVVKPAEHTATINGEVLDLTAKEFAVLEYMAHHSGQVVTRSMLMEHIWGDDFESFSNVIDVYIRNLRKEMSTYSDTAFITTIRGKGYRLGGHETVVEKSS